MAAEIRRDADGDPYEYWLIEAKRMGLYPSKHYPPLTVEQRYTERRNENLWAVFVCFVKLILLG